MQPDLVLEAVIGSGVTGIVYKGRWGHRPVAAKKFHITVDEGAQEAIQKEIDTLQLLRNRYIIQFYGTFYHDDALMILTDLAEGGSLKAAIENGIEDWSTKERLAKEIALGLSFIHSNDVLHLDLKSDNVLLTSSMEVKLCDFGCAMVKTTGTTKSAGSHSGAVRWMAPELFNRRPKYSTKSDVYSFGMVMWELAANCTVPFEKHHDNFTVISLIKDGKREELPEDTPAFYRAWVERCWNHDPSKRPEASDFIPEEPDNFNNIGMYFEINQPSGTLFDTDTLSDPSQQNERSRNKQVRGGSPKNDADSNTPRPKLPLDEKPTKNAASLSSVSPLQNSAVQGPQSKPFLLVPEASKSVSKDIHDSIPCTAAIDPLSSETPLIDLFSIEDFSGNAQAGSIGSGSMENTSSTPSSLWSLSKDFNTKLCCDADDSNNGEQQTLLMALHDKGGKAIKQNEHEVFKRWLQAAEQGHLQAQHQVREMDSGGHVVDQSDQRDAKRCLLSAQKSHADSQLKIGPIYLDGQGVQKEEAQAALWLCQAAWEGNAVAQGHFGMMFLEGRGAKQSDTEAFGWLVKAANQGNADAQYNLGWMYKNGRGVKQSDVEAFEWLTKAADEGHAYAQFSLGLLYVNGQGVKRSDAEAVKWFEKAANQGHASAQSNLGVMYEVGRGILQNYVEAVKWYKKAASKGHAGGQSNLGRMYKVGRGVTQDDTLAAEWLMKAAKQGVAHAQSNLGWMYKNGRGVEQSDSEAVEWFAKAANQGNQQAQFNLGVMYENGRGVKQSKVKAAKWYIKSANQGSVEARLNLQFMEWDG